MFAQFAARTSRNIIASALKNSSRRWRFFSNETPKPEGAKPGAPTGKETPKSSQGSQNAEASKPEKTAAPQMNKEIPKSEESKTQPTPSSAEPAQSKGAESQMSKEIPKSEGSKETKTEIPPILTDKEIRAKIKRERPRFMGIYILLGFGGFVASMMYYLNESDRHERHIQATIKMVSSVDPSRKRQGLEEIGKCLYLEKRMLFGYTHIPQPKHLLIEAGLIEALVNSALNSEDPVVQQQSFMWLTKFSDEPSARALLVKMQISKLIQKVNSLPIGQDAWVAGVALLSALTTYEDTVRHVDPWMIKQSIRRCFESFSPLGTLASVQLTSNLLKHGVSRDEFQFIPPNLYALYNSPTHAAAFAAAVRRVVPPQPRILSHTLQLEHVNMAIFFGLFGTLYGTSRWFFRSFFKGFRGQPLFKFARRRGFYAGFTVFSLLMMDLLAQLAMATPENGYRLPWLEFQSLKFKHYQLKVPEYLEPRNTIIPIIESGLFIFIALYGLSRYRYIILPLLLAAFTKGSVENERKLLPSFSDVEKFVSRGSEVIESLSKPSEKK